MDLLTHSATGAFIGWALPQRREGSSAAPFVIAGALLPDADTLIEPFLDPQSGFVHRGFSHSLVGVGVLAPLIALVALLLFRARGFGRLVALIAIGMFSHLLLDLPTPMGAKVFYPFSDKCIWICWVTWTGLCSLWRSLSSWPAGPTPSATRPCVVGSCPRHCSPL